MNTFTQKQNTQRCNRNCNFILNLQRTQKANLEFAAIVRTFHLFKLLYLNLFLLYCCAWRKVDVVCLCCRRHANHNLATAHEHLGGALRMHCRLLHPYRWALFRRLHGCHPALLYLCRIGEYVHEELLWAASVFKQFFPRKS